MAASGLVHGVCTVITLFRPGHDWPLLLAAIRDERIDRAWDPPGEYWPGYPGVVAGRDQSAGGTWMGINAAGVVATVLNRPGTLGPADGKRSRGDLPLMALARDDAADATHMLHGLDAGLWRGFNMVVADRHGAFFIRGVGHGRPTGMELAPGLSIVTAHDPNDADSPRVARHLQRFHDAAVPVPGDWHAWEAILADSTGASAEQLNVLPRGGFGTVSASLLALPASGRPVWRFAAGPPDRTAWTLVKGPAD